MPEAPHEPTPAPEDDTVGREFTIDELAVETQVPSRTIRF